MSTVANNPVSTQTPYVLKKLKYDGWYGRIDNFETLADAMERAAQRVGDYRVERLNEDGTQDETWQTATIQTRWFPEYGENRARHFNPNEPLDIESIMARFDEVA